MTNNFRASKCSNCGKVYLDGISSCIICGNKTKRVLLLENERMENIAKQNWLPIDMTSDVFQAFRNIPEGSQCLCSGVFPTDNSTPCGGVNVYRDASGHSEPYEINFDHYRVFWDSENEKYYAIGPLKSNEHWTNEEDIPDIYKECLPYSEIDNSDDE